MRKIFTQLSAKEMKEIAVMAPELGRYVCRRCGTCADKCPQGIDFEELFRLEGLYDRQMRTGQITDTGDFALRDRLRFWFGAQDRARKEYEVLPVKGDACINCGDCARLCPYGIDIERKVSIADYKLAGREKLLKGRYMGSLKRQGLVKPGRSTAAKKCMAIMTKGRGISTAPQGG